MYTTPEIRDLLAHLATQPAATLEGQTLDFKEWDPRSMKKSVDLLIESAICMANGGGGSLVFGVKDSAIGRDQAILGVPPEVDINLLKKAVYDSTDPKLTPVIDELRVVEGSGRLLVVHIFPGLPPYTDTQGRGKIRVGADCQPLTGSLRQRVMVATGESDFTAQPVAGKPAELLSAAALEALRESAARERAPADLLQQSDEDLLRALGLLRHEGLTRAGLLLVGKEAAIRTHFPGFAWSHLRMASDTLYHERADGATALLLALRRLLERIMDDNPIATLAYGLFHFEYRTYPEIALREALLNALSHSDFRLPGVILVKQYADKVEISNPGSLIGGITPTNILHHPPVSRNPTLVNALTQLRLVNRSNLGVRRMYEALLIEGKEPPLIHDAGDAVTVTFWRRELSPAFRAFVATESQQGRLLGVDQLLVLRHLLYHPEIDTATAAHLCQRSEAETRALLNELSHQLGYLERGGAGRGTYWTLSRTLHEQWFDAQHRERNRRIDWEAAKHRVLTALLEHTSAAEAGLSNTAIRQLTRFDRQQVKRLMAQLQAEGQVTMVGKGKYARWVHTPAA